jgi:hypothetical protein
VWLCDCQLQQWSVLADANLPSALQWSPGGNALYFQDTDEVDGTVGVSRSDSDDGNGTCDTRFGDLLSFGATRCIFTGVSPDESVYVTADHRGVEVYSVDLKLP